MPASRSLYSRRLGAHRLSSRARAVFGRCIAGRGLQGNMPYFTMVIVMGYAGAITTGAAGVAALTGVISDATGATG